MRGDRRYGARGRCGMRGEGTAEREGRALFTQKKCPPGRSCVGAGCSAVLCVLCALCGESSSPVSPVSPVSLW